MADQIQRVPTGLSSLLSTFGGTTPRMVADEVHGSLELIQYYGLSQRTILSTTNAALAEGSPLAITCPNVWCVLFAAEMNIVKTGTLTALRASLSLIRATSGASVCFHAEELGPYGATETGTARMSFVAPYPLLLPPGSNILSRADIIGTDANVSAQVLAEIGVLG